jgi:hypothetical protein
MHQLLLLLVAATENCAPTTGMQETLHHQNSAKRDSCAQSHSQKPKAASKAINRNSSTQGIRKD